MGLKKAPHPLVIRGDRETDLDPLETLENLEVSQTKGRGGDDMDRAGMPLEDLETSPRQFVSSFNGLIWVGHRAEEDGDPPRPS